jgi:hypothetical protein
MPRRRSSSSVAPPDTAPDNALKTMMPGSMNAT